MAKIDKDSGNNTSNIVIRPLAKGDIQGYIDLHALIFWNARLDPKAKKYFEWKLYQNPAGPSHGAVAIAKDKLTGIYASVPLQVSLNNKIYICYEVVASSVHPDYRGRYIFHKLFSKTKEVILKEKSVLMFGFPNEIALKIGEKSLLYRRVLYIREYVKVLDFRGFIDKRKHSIFSKTILYLLSPVMNCLLHFTGKIYKPSFYRVNTKPISELPSDYDEFWEEAKKKYKIIIVRDKSHLQWRFFDEPYLVNEVFEARIDQRLVGYFVLRFKDKCVYVIDFFCLRKEKIIKSVFYTMLNLAKQRKAWKISFKIRDDYIEELISKEKFTVENASAFVIEDIYSPGSDFEDGFSRSKDWYLTSNSFDIG